MMNERIQELQAEQEPFKMICPRCKVDRVTTQCPNRGGIGDCPMTATAQSAAPVQQAEQRSDSERMEPVGVYYGKVEGVVHRLRLDVDLPIGTPLYAAPVRTKDLTDDEIDEIESEILMGGGEYIDVIRAAIAADREKNK